MFKILIVDDDEDLLESLGRILKLKGFGIYGLSNAEKTFEIVDLFKPDLIILDITLCNHDGRDICRKLKLNPATNKIKILLYSAIHDHENDYCEYGADGFLKKPFESIHLIDKINFHLSL
jgi:DNA-binding response OmpR family regulator